MHIIKDGRVVAAMPKDSHPGDICSHCNQPTKSLLSFKTNLGQVICEDCRENLTWEEKNNGETLGKG